MKAKKLFTSILNELVYPSDQKEREAIVKILLEDAFQISPKQVFFNEEVELDPLNLREKIQQLNKGIPVQYVVQKSYFYGLMLQVNHHVLIPRPETEELVDRLLKQRKFNSILDICTGSGCIALALKSKLVQSYVEAWELSEEALQIAKSNGAAQSLEIHWCQKDVLQISELPSNKFDLIVSNPPYVLEEEKVGISAHVLNHEPHLALFVPNHDPLLFYRHIAAIAKNILEKGGVLAFEINAAFAKQTKELVRNHGFRNVQIIKDLFGKDRFVFAENM